MSSSPAPAPELRRARHELLVRLDDVGNLDAHRLRSRIRKARADQLEDLGQRVDAAAERLHRRAASVPTPRYPEQLPVSARKDEIAAAIRDNQVVVIAGETGSGKTTQIPKICLELGRGVRGMIGHTQPRRLAARSVAERIAEELGVETGRLVGSAVRFDDRTSADTAVKLMTDGILLAEIRRDRLLHAYDTIIIDEAHERSLNIDFLLGYLRQILPRRPDLKLIITSATIDPDRFARHFADAGGRPAPVIEVSGRTYPVEVRYRPLQVEQGDRTIDLDPLDGLADAVAELLAEQDGDVLVFLSGEREIRDAEEVLRGRRFKSTEIFPLYARLTAAEQQKAFRQHSTRRVVLSTNIAETSVTVPGIRYVVDTGLARISRYSTRTKVQRLPIEPVSQASAAQRAGRCGRVADGICIRLYSEEDFDSRPEFTDPEILRTNLASVILSMADLDLGAVDDFPFVEPPDHKAIRDGMTLLTELGALRIDDDERPHLTKVGRDMAALPLDPRLARMVVEGHRNGSLGDVLVVVAALTVQDVRERPAEERDKADQFHRRYADKSSDFLGYLNLWRYLTEQRRELSGSAFRKMCKAEYLHWLRIREWQDLTAQLTSMCRERGWHPPSGHAAEDDLHKAILSGLLTNVGMKDEETREFRGTRGIRFQVFPGSDLARKPPRWVMASELVETSRLWARDVARIDPGWIEQLGDHLVRSQYSEPHWSDAQGAAMAYEKVMLLGLTVVESRRILLSRIDAPLARELLVRHGIVEGRWSTRIPVIVENAVAVEQARELETRSRRRDLVIDDEALVAFYLDRLPAELTSGRHLDSWWKKEGHTRPELLRLKPEEIRTSDTAPSATDFPPFWRQGERSFELRYAFDPGVDADGITVRIPLPQLSSVTTAGFEWLVPGLRENLYTEMLRTLPKYLRRLCSPPAEFATLLSGDLTPRSAPLPVALAAALSARTGTTVDARDFRPELLPDHLRMRFEVVDGEQVVASGTDLAALRTRLVDRVRDTLNARLVPDDGPHREWTADTIGDLLPSITGRIDGVEVTVYPALRVRPDGIHRIACATEEERRATQAAAVLTMVSGGLVSSASIIRGRPVTQRLALTQYPHGGAEGLVSDASLAACGRIIARRKGVPVLTVADFTALRAAAGAEVPGAVASAISAALPALVAAQSVYARLQQAEQQVAADVAPALDFLLGKGFLARHPAELLPQLERHVRAVDLRLDMAEKAPARYRDLTATLARSEATVAEATATLRKRPGGARAARELRWLLAEYRVGLFAQSLGTARPVSPERIDKAVAAALAQRAKR
ncbi:ATP-dependent RNA helicase HrpA [Rhodococcus sp. IEGM 1408]|uniref:ATP-dependent RNA helicase HrpA n=1 Tax=Rhodococcus sp. IEGM 1408 TaxID=3082220 RepID=UPI00295308AD|nr:ATP-dependent RNA helicase HrpA [Rhodococcus sp. IEGM 1408]MDV8000386.1 ATP-dependent RNA helicase HrpA [Rhodococcus sp. IEGM 1408]